MTKEQVFAVDGDIIAYKTAAVIEDHFEGAGYDIIDNTLSEIATDTGICKMRIYISDKTNFRHEIAKTKPYKGNRATIVRPQFLQQMKDYLITKYNATVVDNYEADDAIATDMVVNGAIHCGVDKDILQIAGSHYNYVKKEWQIVTEEEAEITLYRQVLMGDSSDNIPGLPRIGEAKAAQAITSAETAQDDCRAMYEKVVNDKLPEIDHKEYFNEQLMLISMCTSLELDYNKFTIITPKEAVFEAVEDGFLDFQTKEVEVKL